MSDETKLNGRPSDKIHLLVSRPIKIGLCRNLNGGNLFGIYHCDEFMLIRFFGVYVRFGHSENEGG